MFIVTCGQRVRDRPCDAFGHVDEERFDDGAHERREHFADDKYQMDDRKFPVAVFLVRRPRGHPVQREGFPESLLDLLHVVRRKC